MSLDFIWTLLLGPPTNAELREPLPVEEAHHARWLKLPSPLLARLPFAPSVLVARGLSSRSSISPSHAFESRARAARNGFFAAAARREGATGGM